MKNKIIYFISFICLIFTFEISILYAQFEDDEIEEELDAVSCTPESLTTPYDKSYDPNMPYEDVRKFYSFGSEYYKNKNYKSGLPYLWKVFINDTTKYAQPAIRKIADSYFNLQMADSTLIACCLGLEKFSDHTSLHYYAGYILDKAGKFRCAIPHYEALVESDPKNKDYLEKLAFLYYKDENEKAIEIQQQLVNLDPKNERYNEGLVSYTNYFFGAGGVLEVLKAAREKDPKNMEFALAYGVAACEAGRYKDALTPLSDVIKKDKKNIKAYEMRAVCYESMEKYTSAIDDLKNVVNIQPDNVKVMCTIAVNYKYMNQFTNGRYWVGRALNAKPGYGLAYITMAEIYEAAVTHCQNKENRKRKYDDGLVYEIAVKEYRKAANDPNFRSIANSRINSLATVLPTDEEKFMNQNRTELKMKCYTSWIN